MQNRAKCWQISISWPEFVAVFLLLFFAPGNGQRWAKGDEEEFDQRGCQGPPDGHHRRHSDRPIYLWKMQGEMLHLHTGTHCCICHPNYASILGFLSGSPRKNHIKSSEFKYTAQQNEGSIWWLQFNSTRQSHFLEAGSNNDCKVLAAFVQMRQPTGEWRENLQDSPCSDMLLLVATNQFPLILSGCFWTVEHLFQCTPTLQLWHIHMCHGQTVDCVSVSRRRHQEAGQYTRRSRGGL